MTVGLKKTTTLCSSSKPSSWSQTPQRVRRTLVFYVSLMCCAFALQHHRNTEACLTDDFLQTSSFSVCENVRASAKAKDTEGRAKMTTSPNTTLTTTQDDICSSANTQKNAEWDLSSKNILQTTERGYTQSKEERRWRYSYYCRRDSIIFVYYQCQLYWHLFLLLQLKAWSLLRLLK